MWGSGSFTPGRPRRVKTSRALSEQAPTRTRMSPGPSGSCSKSSSRTIPSGPPNSRRTAARILVTGGRLLAGVQWPFSAPFPAVCAGNGAQNRGWSSERGLRSGGELLLVDLVGARERQLVHEHDVARVRVGGAVGEGEVLQLLLGRRRALLQHHEGEGHGALALVGDGHHARRLHGRVALEQRLDLARVHVLAAAHE